MPAHGFAVPEFIVAAARKHAARSAEGQSLWMKEGRFLEAGATLIQEELGRLLQSVAKDGPEAFYQGPFAENYVKRSQQDGGKLRISDLRAGVKWSAPPPPNPRVITGGIRFGLPGPDF